MTTNDPASRSAADITTTPSPSASADITLGITVADLAHLATGGDLTSVVDRLLGGRLIAGFKEVTWAEEEIETAQTQHRRHTDRLYHSLVLLVPTGERMATEFVYRSHCRELLLGLV